MVGQLVLRPFTVGTVTTSQVNGCFCVYVPGTRVKISVHIMKSLPVDVTCQLFLSGWSSDIYVYHVCLASIKHNII